MYSNFWSVRRNTLAGMAGEEEEEERGKKKSLLPSLPDPPPLFPSSLFSTPFDTRYAGYNTSL